MNQIKHPTNSTANEQGFASLVVGLILVIVAGLLAVGFAQLSRHEEQSALNSQLASQAYYAAESGINDAIHDINTIGPSGVPYINSGNASDTNCMSASGMHPVIPAGALTATPDVDPADSVSYTCLLVALKTTDLKYAPVDPDASRTVVTSTSSPLDSLNISWQSHDSHTSYVPAATFPQLLTSTTWNDSSHTYPGVLEFTITPLTGSLNRSGLIGNTFTVYTYPSAKSGGSIPYSPGPAGNQAQIVSGHCGPPVTQQYACNVKITGLSAQATGQYLIHFLNLYDPSDVDITGQDASGTPVTFSGGQAQIDVTGKAKNVLKRLQVRVPLNSSSNYPAYAIEAQNVCKLMETTPTSTQFDDTNGNALDSTDNSPCNLK